MTFRRNLSRHILIGALAAAITVLSSLQPADRADAASVPEICAARLSVASVASTVRLQLPYCTNRSLVTVDASVRRLVIVIHGDSRNAVDHQRYVVQAAQTATVSDALIIAPQFLIADDIAGARLPTSTLYWDDGWKEGQQSARVPSARPWSVSSFAVVDELIRVASNRKVFPNLRQVTVVGHSAGGQWTNRYAAETRIESQLASLGNTYRFVVANPSSYLYVTADRYHRATGRFGPLTASELSQCPRYNRYKHGLELLNPFGATVGAAPIRTQYGQKNVTYLLGAADTSRTDPTLDGSCAAIWQGSQRLERGQIYLRHLSSVYGAGVASRHRITVVAGVAHDAKALYTSTAGRSVLFP